MDDLNGPPVTLSGGLDILFHPSGGLLLSAGDVWDINAQQRVFSYGDVDYRQISPDGHYLLTAKQAVNRTELMLYQLPQGSVLHTFSVDGVYAFQEGVFSNDLSRLALIFRTPHRPFSWYSAPASILICSGARNPQRCRYRNVCRRLSGT
ncbi:MAG: hypothetical protein IPK19_41845 [Chloroflexi bacterium]|nr:hypothetical protein [Chloroflexota bacterium]